MNKMRQYLYRRGCKVSSKIRSCCLGNKIFHLRQLPEHAQAIQFNSRIWHEREGKDNEEMMMKMTTMKTSPMFPALKFTFTRQQEFPLHLPTCLSNALAIYLLLSGILYCRLCSFKHIIYQELAFMSCFRFLNY